MTTECALLEQKDWSNNCIYIYIGIDHICHKEGFEPTYRLDQSNPRSYGVGSVLWDFPFGCKIFHIGYIWKASPQCALSCDSANRWKKCKCSCIGYTCVAFLLCASSSRELLFDQLEYWKTRTLCICEAFPQSGFFCASSERLIELKHSHIDCTCVVSLQCVP